MLSNDGMIYSWGKDKNEYGVLGISKGHNEQPIPCPLQSLVDYSIKSVKLSESKAWAIDRKGKLFIWGTFDTTQNYAFSNITSNSIIIPKPMQVDILNDHFIVKATPFAFKHQLEEVGTNICYKTFTKDYKVN